MAVCRVPWSLAVALSIVDAGMACAAETSTEVVAQRPVRFTNAYFRDANGNPLDTARFSHGNPVVPGNYPVDLYVNDGWITRRDLDIGVNEQGAAIACLQISTLVQSGLDLGALPDAARAAAMLIDGQCVEPAEIVPGARVVFDSGELRLDVELPQAYLKRRPRGYVEPALWDHGVTAAMLGYDANVYRSWSNGLVSTQGYIGLDGGFNFKGWQMRHQGSFTSSDTNVNAARHRYAAMNTYLRHDVMSLHARFIGGQSFTPGDMFDGLAFTGVQISSDDRMLPDSMRSYAPVVRGVASSNARVTVRQGAVTIYETSVSPGPFVIDDLYDTGYAGDLAVTVTEADGTSHGILLPYASIPQLLRPGTHRFSVAAGTLRDQSVSGNRAFLQGTFRRGVTNGLTLYAGVMAARQYQTVLAGTAFSMPWGAFAGDLSQSWTQGLTHAADSDSVQGVSQGQSYRLTYSKRVDATDTSITLGAYRHSSSGYMSLLDAERLRSGGVYIPSRVRNRFQLAVSQALPGDLGSLYVNAHTANFWERGGSDLGYAAGYMRAFRRASLALNVQRSRTRSGMLDTQVMTTITVPLDRLPRMPVMQLRANYIGEREVATQASVTGAGNDARTLNYNAYGEYRSPCCGSSAGQAGTGSGGISGSYMTGIGTIGASAGGGSGYAQLSVNVSGGVVAHPRGLTLSQRVGEAIAVIEAPGADGAPVLNANGIRVGDNGFAVQPALSPYQLNDVGLEGAGAREDVDVLGSSTSVVPRSGAVVMVKVRTEQGQPLMFRAMRANDMPVPMGAEVLHGNGKPAATVGQGGLIFLRGASGEQTFRVKWGKRDDQQCIFRHAVGVVQPDDRAVARPALRVSCE